MIGAAPSPTLALAGGPEKRPALASRLNRLIGVQTAGELIGKAALAEDLGIDARSLRKKLGAERGISNADVAAVADVLDARAARMIAHAAKLRGLVG